MRELKRHIAALSACTLCADMQRPAVTGRAVPSRVMLVGQAPGEKEPVLQRPFAWTAGRTLFQWFEESCGLDEEQFRARVYMAAVCRCFPGKKSRGGDRVPRSDEIASCSRWLEAEMRLLKPELVIPVGKLAIARFTEYRAMEKHVGSALRCIFAGHEFHAIPLPHPSGASPWPRVEPGKTLLRKALKRIARHPAMKAIRSTSS